MHQLVRSVKDVNQRGAATLTDGMAGQVKPEVTGGL
jgi:hypothetical protein